jgi:hypothetical protein
MNFKSQSDEHNQKSYNSSFDPVSAINILSSFIIARMEK